MHPSFMSSSPIIGLLMGSNDHCNRLHTECKRLHLEIV